MNKDKKQIILMISSFFIGQIVLILLLKFTPIINSKNLVVIKDKTKVYEKTSLSSAIDKIYDAVVVVQNYMNDNLKNNGSGFVYKIDDKYAYIMTNAHVIENADTVKIVFTSEEEEEATVLGQDPYLDLAVLRVSKKYVSLIANIGNSNNIKIGDTIFVIGTPLGYTYRGSVTSGILSGKDRMVSVGVTNENDNDWLMNVLQIDASINPGNSGGPVLNINGEVIGVCSLKLVDDDIEGMGFAIPIEFAMSHIKTLEEGKEIKWPILGINMANTTDTTKLIRNDISISKEQKEGIVILDIKEETSASSSNLKKGDIIIKLNGEKVKDIAHLRYELYKYQAGDTIEISYIRNNHEKTTKIKLKGNN